MNLSSTERYSKKEKKFFAKRPHLIDKYSEILNELQNNHNTEWLKLHKLKGKLSDFHAVSLTHEYRIVLILKIIDNEIVLFNIGTHDEVYRDC